MSEWQLRRSAEQRIVAAVYDGNEPSGGDVRIWLRGGAAFWGEEHSFICWGLYVPKHVYLDEVVEFGLREAIREAGDRIRTKFGRIAVRGRDGENIVAVSIFDSFQGDRLYGFFPTEEHFRQDAERKGWLLGDVPDLSDAVGSMSDEELERVYRRAPATW